MPGGRRRPRGVGRVGGGYPPAGHAGRAGQGGATLDRIRQLKARVDEHLWSREPLTPAPLTWLRSLVQLTIVIGEGFARDHLLMRAHALTFLTLLAIVPLLALAVSLLRLLGGGDHVVRLIVELLAAGAPEAGERILEFVDRLDFGALGTVGGAILIATSLMMVGNVERSLNAVWGVQKQRPWTRRIPDYLAVLLITPLLLGVAISLGTTLQSQWMVQRLLELPGAAFLFDIGLKRAPTLLVISGFTFLYWFMPNTSVRPLSALLGGVVAGILFTTAQTMYLGLQVGAAKYDAIFGSFAILPLLMVWVYFSWAIALLGAEVAYAHQTLNLYRREVRGAPAGPAARESIGLGIALAITDRFQEGEPPWAEDGLSDHLDVPLRTVRDVVAQLEKAGLILPVEDRTRQGVYQLARPAERIAVSDVLDALRGPREVALGAREIARAVDGFFATLDRRRHAALETATLAELAASSVDPAAAGQ